LPDAKDIALLTLRLREERDATSDGRVDLIVVSATDTRGGTGGEPGRNRPGSVEPEARRR